MSSLTMHSHYDAHVEINQCHECGGLWFDDSEFYMIKQGLAAVIDAIDREKLKALTPTATELHCPRDGALLSMFKDPSFPKSIQVEFCPTCRGFWFNRGEFRDWQTYRAEKLKEVPSDADNKFDKDISSLLTLCGTNDQADSLSRLGNVMMAAYGQPEKMSPVREDSGIEASAQVISLVNNLIGLFRKSEPDYKNPEKEQDEVLVKAKILNILLKLFAAGLTVYFFISEARSVLGTQIFYSQLDVCIWYFRTLMSLIVLPVFYVFKFVNYVQMKYAPVTKVGVVNSAFFQAEVFYYTIYGILFLLTLMRLFD
jgi:uncharacterized protein